MTEQRRTRLSRLKTDSNGITEEKKMLKVFATQKVIFVAGSLLHERGHELKLQRFYHPVKEAMALFVTDVKRKEIWEIIEMAEPRRSWLIDQVVCSNGKLYITTPIDVTFLAIYYLRKYCTEQALDFSSIGNEKDMSDVQLLSTFIEPDMLKCVADVKQLEEQSYYKYNANKALAWLAIKTKRLCAVLKQNGIHCGTHAVSQNFVKTDNDAVEVIDDKDYLRMACEIIGDYLDLELHEQLMQYLHISSDTPVSTGDSNNGHTTKRKSLKALASSESKKAKLAEDIKDNASCMLAEPTDSEMVEEHLVIKPHFVKDRALSTKEKALAKSAKGTKSIVSFFKK